MDPAPLVDEFTSLLTENELLRQEALATSRRRRGLGLHSASSHGIGICFAGGGVRAASFDCGFLWKLGELGLLKDIDVVSAVSGGGYTASAYISHVAGSETMPPTNDSDAKVLDAWYLLAVCQLIIRFQDNIGYLVTTSHSLFFSGGKKRGGTVFGRIFDIPAFTAIIIGMPIANIFTFIIFWGLPLARVLDLNHGRSMRAYLCSRTNNYYWFPSFAIFLMVIAFILYLALIALERLAPSLVALDKPRHDAWLFHRATKVVCSRTALLALVYGVLVCGCMGMEQYDYGRAYQRDAVKCACASFYGWDVYDWSYQLYENTCDSESRPLSNHRSFAQAFVLTVLFFFACAGLVAILGAPSLLGLVARIVGPLIGILVVAYVSGWRVFGPVTRQRLIWQNLPYNSKLWSILFFISCALAIAHLPSQHELPRTLHRFYARSLRRSFFKDGQDVPLGALRDDFDDHDVLQKRQSEAALKMPSTDSSSESPDLEDGGPQRESRSLPQRAGAMTTEAATPTLVLGATINEFRRPEKADERGQMFSMTPRGWGGTHTGYAKPPRWLTLSRAMAISGAAVDGFVLNAFESKALRLALQVTNLTMGDTIRFSGVFPDDDEDRRFVTPLLAAAVELVEAPLSLICGRRDDELVERFRLTRRHRLITHQSRGTFARCLEALGSGIRIGDPLSADELASTLSGRFYEMLIMAIVYAFFALSAAFYNKSSDRESIYRTPSPVFAAIAVCILGAAVLASCYAYSPKVRFLLASPIIQQVHILLNITHYGTRAPPFATLTDGGLQETIGCLELLRRRCRWIVIADTSEDPKLTLKSLRESLERAKQEGVVVGDYVDNGSTKDGQPLDPPMNFDELLSPKIVDLDFVRLRIDYPPPHFTDIETASYTDIFIIKMRKLNPIPKCQPFIKPHEIVRGHDIQPDELPKPLLNVNVPPLPLEQDKINGLCCECCHANCSCLPCGQLPFLSVGNQFLTPFQFTNLCRLAYSLSDAPLQALIQARGTTTAV
eukprot:CAMPEP_0197310304 /NCGR_PEP_ID=MMETSP0891-20130614/8905_1 /TAXON_ID=44058 ORGANISM="Aureoumbra lagunensis, Strain CCMP1510" /NCGR_SAMPLE_ID=MMETSP0891 /ASSEMBLY_ACC=CAM_ASM_000534 /LENGTH=1007 /DNA_ID=CAMNT_0042795887 /DNA_START=101 /DNA_END=3124 /DNA_ORIENTATION=+